MYVQGGSLHQGHLLPNSAKGWERKWVLCWLSLSVAEWRWEKKGFGVASKSQSGELNGGGGLVVGVSREIVNSTWTCGVTCGLS